MKFCKKEEEQIFEDLIDEFCKVHGREALKATFQLNAKFKKILGIKYYPIQNIYHYLLYLDLKSKYKTIPLKKIAEIEGISTRTIYYFYNNYTKRKRKNPESVNIHKPLNNKLFAKMSTLEKN
jgi:hypothetical protein